MSLKKKISIKPIHLIVGGKQKEKKKQKKKSKKMIQSLFKPNKVKQELLEKIKRHQQTKKDQIINGGNTIQKEDFTNDFQESLLYLDKVSDNIKKNKTMKKKERKISNEIQNNPRPAPPYGILKGGKKQLYSQYRKTLKNKDGTHIKLKFNVNENDIKPVEKPLFVTERQNKLQQIKQKINPSLVAPITSSLHKKEPKRFKKTKTLKRKLILGKKGRKVSVLIKNRKTRKRVKNETLKLKKKSLEEIKQYLRIHNLIKIGTDAPEDVLRQTFENAFLSGDIHNKNSENLLHNYINVK